MTGGINTILLLCMIWVVGCMAPKPNQSDVVVLRSVKINDITVNIVRSVEDIAILNLAEFPRMPFDEYYAMGIYNPATKTIWVPQNEVLDENGKVMPNLFLFGHEIWHTIEPGYHSSTNQAYTLPTLPDFRLEWRRKQFHLK
jgi:protocatechuate 3,4-dioxygenase beta subunit